MQSRLIVGGLLPLLGPFAVAQDRQPFFTGLGDLPGGGRSSIPFDVSGDGSVVVGKSVARGIFGSEAFRWTMEEGMVPLRPLDSDGQAVATAVSDDGSVIVGIKPRDDNPNRVEPFMWTAQAGVVGMAAVLGITREARATDISADGSVIVGHIGRTRADAFHWSSQTGLTLLGEFPGGIESSQAGGVSADGRVVVGASVSQFSWRAFRWSDQQGFTMIGDLEGFGVTTGASAASGDGSVIVGNRASNDVQAYRWTEETGMVFLAEPEGRFFQSLACALRPDGCVIIGRASILDSRHQSFIWDAAHGMRDLGEVLESDYGLDLTGWSLDVATAISADGRTIVANALNPEGWTEAIVAFLGDPVPCPADVNADRLVSLTDLAILLANFGIPEGATPADGDTDNDGDTDAADLQTLLEHFGVLCPL